MNQFNRINTVVLVALMLLSGAAMAGSWQNNVSVGGFNKVHIYTPDTQSSVGNGRALLVVLHGCTQSIDAYLTANLEDAAEEYGMVIAVPDAMNKAGFSCWSYWQGTRSRTAGDYKNLISLATSLSGNSAYNIDADQVYIAGLSSGAAFANTAACIAPDVFAGMGISAGPSIGTSSSGAIGSCESANVALRCEQYAGSYSGFLDTQVASIAFGDADTTVDQCYNRQNAEGMADVYGVDELPGSNVVTENGRTADEYLWEDNRVSMLWFNGVDHAWSGGVGASGSYINGSNINYANYLGQYFRDNNPRIDRNTPPELSNVSVQESNGVLTVTGNVSDADNAVQRLDVHIRDTDDNQVHLNTTAVASGTFSVTSQPLPDALYFVSVNASDVDGAISETVTTSVRVGPAPPDTAPELDNLQVTTAAQCATVTGEVFDINQNLASVTVAFSNATVTASISGNLFSAEGCNLPGGSQTATVTATDTTNLASSDPVAFVIDAGQTATLDEHISAGRLDYTNYSNCYLEYSSAPFKLDEVVVSASQCQWQDNDASCVGPQQACSTNNGGNNGGGDNGGDNGGDTHNDCAEFSTANYYHKVAGRAYSTGNYFAPDYFAQGSNTPLSGSTWGVSQLYSTDGETWNVGVCP
ncbi:extracellular catalytic domain type 1 short-chain-length polyhydroxyalkanoate depolymerase [Alteromonas oceanisediminis]|uniref:extracellular catalytic domain type 1 short-chain-length polyhydroxyalkanoate depolymerase n=1 Tax=Alteromonas oceanisediminis TaxID=2836180 RepID=UPI001BDABC1E|nr:PHB depolymerase family esterase [Alteromonas oceanisediminis]MBT0585607.1 PHB depolymerase family esterase [Alteromonas oceanisediminis]